MGSKEYLTIQILIFGKWVEPVNFQRLLKLHILHAITHYKNFQTMKYSFYAGIRRNNVAKILNGELVLKTKEWNELPLQLTLRLMSA